MCTVLFVILVHWKTTIKHFALHSGRCGYNLQYVYVGNAIPEKDSGLIFALYLDLISPTVK